MENEILDQSFAETAHSDIHRSIANKGRRFANYLIDSIVFYVVLFVLASLLAFLNTDFGNMILAGFDNPILSRLYGAVLFMVYYFILEWAMKGKTIGKFITNTKTLMADGSPLTSDALLKRSASRIVPFDAFSFLGAKSNGWHDKWSNTVVVNLATLRAIQSITSIDNAIVE